MLGHLAAADADRTPSGEVRESRRSVMVEAASDYPLMNVFWTMVMFFAWMIWIWLLITIFADLFSRRDVGGWAKAGWTVVVLVLPFIGVLAYLISQSSAMADRRMAQVKASQESFDS